MKKILFLAVFFLCAFEALAQNYNPINFYINREATYGIKINTTLPFTSYTNMPTLQIKGYNYETAEVIDISLVWYVYGGEFYNYSASSSGAYVPDLYLSNQSGYVSIFIDDRSYYQRFTISAFAQGLSEVSTWFQDWTIEDTTLTGINEVLVPYKNSFRGTIKFHSNSIWESGGKLGIGTTSPATDLHVAGLTTFGSGRFQTNNDGFFLTAGSSAYAGPWANIPQVVIRSDESNTGVYETRPSLVLYNANGGLHTGSGLAFASAESSTPGGNDVALSGIFGIKETEGTNGSWSSGGLRFWTKNQADLIEAMTINRYGWVGFGTTTPQKGVDIAAPANDFVTIGAASSMGVGQYSGIHFGYREHSNTLYRKSAIVFERTDNSGGGGNAAGKVHILNGPRLGSGSATMADAALTIDEYGSIGIGTTTPGSYKLNVCGKIRANEVKVDLTGCDFVFASDYKLMSLSDLEKFINANKHLPEILPAAEMEKDGTDLGELNSKLLQKVEELTLYMIEQNKNYNEQKQEIELLKKQIQELSAKK